MASHGTVTVSVIKWSQHKVKYGTGYASLSERATAQPHTLHRKMTKRAEHFAESEVVLSHAQLRLLAAHGRDMHTKRALDKALC